MKTWITLLALASAAQLPADVKLPSIFSDHMVLQREVEVPVWGWADAGEKVTVSFAGQTKSTAADKDGKWSVKLAKLAVSAKPQELKVKGNNEIILKNVLVGDVWICSGQSNMEWPLSKCTKTPKEDAAAQKNNKQLRLFRVPDHVKAAEPAPDTKGTWKTTELEPDCLIFSGCGFFFGAKLQEELDIPIGLIDTSWGGTPVDQWISNKAHQSFLKSDRKESIYNGMVAPLVPFAIKGAIWYQGESNRANDFPAYFTKLDALITGWREDFQVGDFPFYLVQIAPHRYNKKGPGDDETLARNIWAAQYKAAKEIKNCGIVPIHDTLHGVIDDIHPWDKKPVAERLANLALKKDYGKAVAWTGPEFASAKASGSKLTVAFQGIEKGLTTTDGNEPACFEIAGEDKVFVPAKATIQGNTVIVSADGVASPKHVKMGWNEVQVPNLADKNGWPVFQFPPMAAE
ncbi:MAG: sialate O-acetylesterase [Verrucomicrobiales bacterium]